MQDLTTLSIAKAKKLMYAKEFTAVELTEAFLHKIDKDNKDINAYITVTHDLALSQATQAQIRINNGDRRQILDGIPIGIKDVFCTKDVLTTAGSCMLKNFIPTYESKVTELMYANGAICLGKTNMDEFAMGSDNTSSYYGPVINPLKRKDGLSVVPGGSSGGSAAAVAARLCMGALGSDTGGSIRQPASFCGIVGIKPSYGRCSRRGMIAYASSLDTPSIVASSVEDAAFLIDAISLYDAMDSTCIDIQPINAVAMTNNTVHHTLRGIKIGIPSEYAHNAASAEVMRTWELGKKLLQDLGAVLVDITLPNTNHSLSVYYIIALAEASSNLARYDGIRYGISHVIDDATNINNNDNCNNDENALFELIAKTRAHGFNREVKKRIMVGTYALSSTSYKDCFLRAQKVRRLVYNDFQNAFQKVDAIFTPTAPYTAYPINQKPSNPIDSYLNDIYTVPASLAGLPAISLPISNSMEDGLPIGMQIICPRFREDTIFKIASLMEENLRISKVQ